MFASYNMLKLGYQQLLQPVEVELNSYAWRKQGQKVMVDALEACASLKVPVTALCGSEEYDYYTLTTESKIRLGEELERTLKYNGYHFERVSKSKLKRAKTAAYNKAMAELKKRTLKPKDITSRKMSVAPPQIIVDAGYLALRDGKVIHWDGSRWAAARKATMEDNKTLPYISKYF